MPLVLTRLQPGRIAAIDTFRGLTFLVMVWVNEMHGVSGIPAWLKHMPADADAMSFVDAVFPAFLFIVGMSIPFSIQARIARGDSGWALQGHLLYRGLALVVMGLFMVNAEDGFNAAAMPIPIALWSLLFYAAVGLVWGVYRFGRVALDRGLRMAGVVLMLGLALAYRGGPSGHDGLSPQWWGILGLIGWAYLIAAAVYQLARGRQHWLVLAVVACLAQGSGHAAHTSIVLCGVVCALLYFDQPQRAGGRVGLGLAWAAVLLAAGLLARHWFPISKIHATPSWCLLSSAACVVVFTGLYLLVDRGGRASWFRLVEPAASNPLVTYLIPFAVLSLMQLGQWKLPDAWRQGALGIAESMLYAVAVLGLVAWLNRHNFRLKI